MHIKQFQEIIRENYHTMNRQLPWREPETDGQFNAYKILVSEIMLQQTQALRVTPKYLSFIEKFPDVQNLATASLATVLAEWNGLGYNRRAKYLYEAAKQLSVKSQPWTLEDLVACKGIEPNTAAAVCVYAYSQPLVFVETNIRTVFIHHFFQDRMDVSDKEIFPLIEKALLEVEGKEQPERRIYSAPSAMRKSGFPQREDSLRGGSTAGLSHYREWYWALMDYGVYIKSTVGNTARASKHYTKQSRFEGSKRQIRGQVLRLLGGGDQAHNELAKYIPDERLDAVLADLRREGLISIQDGTVSLG